MDKLIWILYGAAILVTSGLIGWHIGRFREAYTEMTGMMAGMMMGMLNGFLLGYCAAAAANSMFWGNLIGIVLGLASGVYFGRAGGLMGIMDGAMGGIMGGSMGAMLAIMLVFPREGIWITAIVLGLLYIAGMVGLVVLIEQSAPGHAALHRLLPVFTRAVATEAAEQAEWERHQASTQRTARPSAPGARRGRRLVDYYALLGVAKDASADEIREAYFEKIDDLRGDEYSIERLDRAFSTLTDARRREAYDRKLGAGESFRVGAGLSEAGAAATVALSASSSAPGDCCPPPRNKRGQATGVSEEPGVTKVEQPKNAVSPALAPTKRGAEAGTATVRVNSSAEPATQSDVQPLPARRTTPTHGPNPGPASYSNAPAPGSARNQGGGGNIAGRPQGSGGKRRNNGGNRGDLSDPSTAYSQQHAKGQGGRRPGRQQVQYARTEQPVQRHTVVSLPLALGVATLLLLVLLGWWILSMNGPSNRTGQATNLSNGTNVTNSANGASSETGSDAGAASNLEAQAVIASVGADGTQTLDLAINGDTISYEPPVIKVKQGVPVRFNLSIKGRDPG